MADTRTRVRKPDPETAAEENITTEETVMDDGLAGDGEITDAQPVEAVQLPAELSGPFTRDGFHIRDNANRRILLCGVEGDIVRTGPGIAEAIVQKLNKAYQPQ